MNIFVLSKDPEKAAKWQLNKHVVKMPTETAQLLCAAFKEKHSPPYRPTHVNHRCAVWTRESSDNFDWLIEHGLALCAEYKRRYGRVHASLAPIKWCRSHRKLLDLSREGLTKFAQAMPDQYKNASAVRAYRDYYIGDKWHIGVWKPPSEPPFWWPYAPLTTTFPPQLLRSLSK